MSEVWINDVDLADYGFVYGVDGKHNASPTFTDASDSLIGDIGPAWLGEPTQAAARRIVVGGYIDAASTAQRLAYLDVLKALCSLGAVRIRFADRLDQEFVNARLVSFDASPKAAILQNKATDISITFELVDPLRYDVNPIGIALSTTPVALPVGTAPSFPWMSLDGKGASLSNFGWIMRNAIGEQVQSQSFVGSLGASDRYVIDARQTLLTLFTAGVASDGFSLWPFNSGDFPVIRPADGGYELGAGPTMELTGTGTPVGLITYKRRYL